MIYANSFLEWRPIASGVCMCWKCCALYLKAFHKMLHELLRLNEKIINPIPRVAVSIFFKLNLFWGLTSRKFCACLYKTEITY